jgi:hypothetical protein
MSSRLVNVRLDEQRILKARKLRAGGVPLSDLLRTAIDQEYERLVESSKPRDVQAVMKQIYERYPDPPDLPAREYSVHDSVAARKAIRRKLRSQGQ